MPKRRKMPSDELCALIGQQITASTSMSGSDISQERSDAMDRYFGLPYGDEEQDRSQVVSRDVSDAVESILADLMETFTAGDQVVKFEPQGAEDEPAAEQETDVVNYVFYRQNNGFLILYEAFKDALLQKTGYFKWWWETKLETRVVRYEYLTQQAIDNLQAELADDGDEVEIDSQTECESDDEEPPETQDTQAQTQDTQAQMGPDDGMPALPEGYATIQREGLATGPQMPPQMGPGAPPGPMQPPGGMMLPPMPPPPPEPKFDVAFRITSKRGQVRVMVIPPEEALVPPRWGSVFLDDAPFFGHRTRKTQSDLIASGYDADQVKDLPTAGDPDDPERASRFNEETSNPRPVDAQAMREIDVCEAYVRYDLDGDGIAELLKCTVAGQGWEPLLWGDEPPGGRDPGSEDIEEVDEIPIGPITPIIMPHRHFGRSLADIVMPRQRVKTVLERQMLDNIYLNNFPMTVISESAELPDTIDMLLSPAPRRIIRRGDAGVLEQLQPPVMIDQSLKAIEYTEGTIENSSGVTRYNQGLDADSLNKTATGINRIMSAAQRKTQLIARSFAETGVKRTFLGIHGLLQKHSSKAMTIRLRNSWVDVDPREWQTRYDMTVSVGLGTGDKTQELGHMMTIWQGQQQLMQHPNPAFSGMVSPKNVYNVAEKTCALSGLKTGANYFTDPDSIPPPQPQQPPPDPKVMQVQAQSQLEQQKAMASAQMDQMRFQWEQQRAMQQDQQAQAQAALDADIRREKIRADFVLGLLTLNANTGAQLDVAKIDAAVEGNRMVAEAFQSAHQQQMDLAHQAQQATVDRAHQAVTGAAQMAHDAYQADATRQAQAEQSDAQRQHDAEQADAQRAMDAEQADAALKAKAAQQQAGA